MYNFQCFLVLLFITILGSTSAFSAGQYIPKSFYHLNEDGHESDVVYLTKRDVSRFRRSNGGAGFGGGVSYDGPAGIAAAVDAGLRHVQSQVQGFASRSAFAGDAGGGAGAGSFSGSFSGATGGGGAPGAGGATLHSRYAADGSGYEKEYVAGGPGGIHASASASGPNAAFSSSSSSVDGSGRVQYNAQARKY